MIYQNYDIQSIHLENSLLGVMRIWLIASMKSYLTFLLAC